MVRDGNRQVMAILQKYVLKRAQHGVCGGKKSVVGEVTLGSEYDWWFCYMCEKSVVVVVISIQPSDKGPRFKGTDSDQDPDSCPQWSVLLLP